MYSSSSQTIRKMCMYIAVMQLEKTAKDANKITDSMRGWLLIRGCLENCVSVLGAAFMLDIDCGFDAVTCTRKCGSRSHSR